MERKNKKGNEREREFEGLSEKNGEREEQEFSTNSVLVLYLISTSLVLIQY